MVRIVFITGIVAVSLIAICDGQTCSGTPFRCYSTDHSVVNGTCVHVFFNGTGNSWNELQNVCQHDGGRLAWLRSDFNLVSLLSVAYPYGQKSNGSLMVLGLLSSTFDKVGLFWAGSNNTSSYQCTSTETDMCMSSSDKDNCSAIGCCWRNGKCQYPNSQHLSVFNQSVEYYNISGSNQRQCVGYRVNNGSRNKGHWVTYDCFQPLHNAVYACEYKCNTTVWPNTTMTDFTYGEEKNNSSSFERGPTHQTPKSTTLKPKENHMNLESTLSFERGPTHQTPKSTTLKPKENHMNLESTLSFERGPTHQTPKSTTLKPTENHMNLESTLTRLINVFVVVVLLVIMK